MSIYYFGEPAKYRGDRFIPSMCKPSRADTATVLSDIRGIASKHARRAIDSPITTMSSLQNGTPSTGEAPAPKEYTLKVLKAGRDEIELLTMRMNLLKEMIADDDITIEDRIAFQRELKQVQHQLMAKLRDCTSHT